MLATKVVSELRKLGDDRCDGAVAAWVEGVEASACYVSALTLTEIEIGILRVARRDAGQGARPRRWMDRRVAPEFAARTLPVDTAVALRCAALQVPDPRSECDPLIAATALVHGLTVATRNLIDFVGTGVAAVNPWQRD